MILFAVAVLADEFNESAAADTGGGKVSFVFFGDNEKRIEILKAVHKLFSEDAQELIVDSRSFRNSTIMVKQAFNSVLMTLDHTPMSLICDV